ncbi:MAG: hypothetical protein WKF32_00775 [Thermoleophilaceae bacterium]
MTADEALAEEQRLLCERDHANRRDGELAAEIARLNQRRAELGREEVELLKKIARGHDVGSRREDNRREQEETDSAVEQKTEERNAARVASQDADAEVAMLRYRELHALAQDADAYTAEAQEALAEVERPYIAAQETWAAAEACWGRLGPAIAQHMQERQEEEGIHSTPDKADVAAPPFPLPDDGMAFERARRGALIARPGAVDYIDNRKEQDQ